MDTANPIWNVWANDRKLMELYRRRCRGEAEEMTCAAQAAEILKARLVPGETLLDAGCGGGYYFRSLKARGLTVEYHGLDYTPQMIDLARQEMPAVGVPATNFQAGSIENLDRTFDTILCFNVLTNNPHYALPLDRLLACTRKRLLLRESLGERLDITYHADPIIDEEKRHIHVYHNTYPIAEVTAFMEQRGFNVTRIPDRRTNDGIEEIVGVTHHWRILLAERTGTGP